MPVAFVNCGVKKGKWSSEVEVHKKQSSDILRSPAMLDTGASVAALPSDLITPDEVYTTI